MEKPSFDLLVGTESSCELVAKSGSNKCKPPFPFKKFFKKGEKKQQILGLSRPGQKLIMGLGRRMM